MVGILTIHLHIPGCLSLKEKRGRLKPLIARLHREFNVSVAEMDLQDKWQEAIISCALVNNETAQIQRSLQTVSKWVNAHWQDGEIIGESIEIL